eukprot:gene11926-13833_t
MSKGEISESIKVYIRQRPDVIGSSESAASAGVSDTRDKDNISGVRSISADGKACTYYSATSKTQQTFSVDKYFEPMAQQEELYNTIALPIVESALLGYSGTILAYGPTGSGKTHTIRGLGDEQRGIMPRCIEHLLNNQVDTQCEIWASYLQIYCETITDLLWQPSNTEAVDQSAPTRIVAYSANQPLMLRERASNPAMGAAQGTTGAAGVYVEGLSRYKVQSSEDLAELLKRGDLNRATAATNMNETSSRSHAILMLKIITRDENNSSSNNNSSEDTPVDQSSKGNTSFREATLMLVDLAGSERASASSGKSHLRAEEAKAINLSLSALGNCMSALAAQSSQGEKEGMVTLAPGTDTAGESLSALRFASRASKVKVSAQVTRYKDYESLYRDMKKQLKEFQTGGGSAVAGNAVADALQAKLSEQEQAVQNKDRIIEQQSAEISLLKQQLLAVQQAHGTALSSNNANSSAVTTTDASAAPTNSGEWQAKLDTLTQSHLTALESAHKLYTTKLTATQQKEQAALQELHRVQLDLKAERERSLQSMRTVRETQNKSNEEENSYKMRISELLSELSTLRDANEDFERSNAQLQAELAAAHEKINQLGEKLLTSVSKEQVKEMEGLFIETVTKLSERVNMLEGKKTGSEKVVTSNNTNNYVGNSSGGNTREVRIEPGGRIRAGSVKDTNNSNNSGGAYNSS